MFATQTDVPEEWPTHCRLGANGVVPLFCGDHAPGFTGLYAIINGLTLLLSETCPLRPAEEAMLLDMGWRFLAARGPLSPSTGIRSQLVERLADALLFALSRRRQQGLAYYRFKEAVGPRFATILERLLVARAPVVILLGRGHYTVIRGYTHHSWLLFDATGRQWISRPMVRRNLVAGGKRNQTPFLLILSNNS